MLIKTQAICLKSFPYKESSTIVSLLTQELGLKTCIIKGGRKHNAVIKSSYFQPLQPIDVVIYYGNKSSFCQIKECNLTCDMTNTYTNMVKISLSFFLTEVLTLSLKEDNPNEEMFSFLIKTISYLNDCEDEKNLKDFHIYFLYHLACHLGFEPMDNYSEDTPFFDISKGLFVNITEIQTLDRNMSSLFHKVISSIRDNYSYYTQTTFERRDLLNVFILFFEQHITNNRPIKSQKILQTIL